MNGGPEDLNYLKVLPTPRALVFKVARPRTILPLTVVVETTETNLGVQQ